MSANDLAQVGERAVCGACKPKFLQRVLEGAPEPAEPQDLGVETLGFMALVRLGWKVIRADWLVLLAVRVLISVPSEFFLSLMPTPEAENLTSIARSIRVSQFIETVFGVIATLAIAWVVQERLAGRRPALWPTLGHALRRWPAAVLTGWLGGIITVLMLLLLIVPGIIYAGYFTFAAIAVSLRACSGSGALDYSKRLVKGRWWIVVGSAIAFVLPTVAVIVFQNIAGQFLPEYPHRAMVEGVVSDIATIFFTVCLTVMFLNLDAVQSAREARGEDRVLGRRLGRSA